MKVIIFGATGMIGQGVLRECLQDPEVTAVQSIGRTALEIKNPKIQEIIHKDLWNYKDIENKLSGFDAGFFCLGTPSAGKTESEYSKITYDLTMAAAQTLAKLNPQMTFIYVSGIGADSTEKGNVMWARVRGRLENALLKLPFKDVYIFRPGFVEPLDGIKSKTKLYHAFYVILKPTLPLFKLFAPHLMTSTREIGRAMIAAVRTGYSKKILVTDDFKVLSQF